MNGVSSGPSDRGGSSLSAGREGDSSLESLSSSESSSASAEYSLTVFRGRARAQRGQVSERCDDGEERRVNDSGAYLQMSLSTLLLGFQPRGPLNFAVSSR